MGVLDAVLEIFSSVGTWISTAVLQFISMFYTTGTGGEGELTFLGVLAVAGLAISVSFLMIGIIQKFLHFRG